MNLKYLKSGTDVRGVAVNQDNASDIELTDEAIRRITAGFVRFVCVKTEKDVDELVISVGHDSRISAQRIKNAVISICSYWKKI